MCVLPPCHSSSGVHWPVARLPLCSRCLPSSFVSVLPPFITSAARNNELNGEMDAAVQIPLIQEWKEAADLLRGDKTFQEGGYFLLVSTVLYCPSPQALLRLYLHSSSSVCVCDPR